MRKVSRMGAMHFAEVDPEKEMDEFMAIRDMAKQGDTEATYKRLSNFLWNFSLNKSMTNLQQRKLMESESGGTASVGGERLTAEQAAQLPAGTPFVDLSGVPRVIR